MANTDLQPSCNYVIVVQGQMDGRWSGWFNGLELAQRPGGQTVLTGPVTDQAALHGILSRIRDLGLPLLFLRRADFHSEESTKGE